LSYLLRFAKDRGILGKEMFDNLAEQRDRVGKLTWGLYSSLADKVRSEALDRPTA